ncbi:hypothetical protein [Oxynema aestuarii]|uniref:Uncharacterized protein n=1 Tax=Oxynema aestuarii AP17 TaxID=2064643 RepID=A0A6H1U245_9CYAN|nr:hypothetical protein [Oxynema aestuarii]QIZ72240.1 hypothetical protein HCG48_18025 [Oxynema aestuarii AP17]
MSRERGFSVGFPRELPEGRSPSTPVMSGLCGAGAIVESLKIAGIRYNYRNLN